MTSAGPVEGEHTAWDGESSAVQDLRDLLVPLAPEGALRIVLQRLALHESSRPVGEHEVLDVVADVEGNLVSVPLRGRAPAPPPTARPTRPPPLAAGASARPRPRPGRATRRRPVCAMTCWTAAPGASTASR